MASFFVRSRPTANRASSTAYSLGQKIVSTSAVAFLGICFEVTTAGTSAGGGEPAWNTTVGGTTTDGGVTWTTRGAAGIWLATKAYAVGDRVCKVNQQSRSNASSVVWDCTTAGTSGGSEPSWPTTITAGTTTQTDGGVTWTARACTTWDNANPFIGAMIKDNTNSSVKVSAGDTIYVSNGHAENFQASTFSNTYYDFPGTFQAVTKILCVSDTGQPSSPTTLATTGTITHATGASNAHIYLTGVVYMYGLTWVQGATGNLGLFADGSSFANRFAMKLEACSLQMTNASNTNSTLLGVKGGSSAGGLIDLLNTTLSFSNTNQQLVLYNCRLRWKNTVSAIQGTVTTVGLINLSTGNVQGGLVEFDGVDLSVFGSNPIFSNGYYASHFNIVLRNCKLGSSFVLFASVSIANLGPSTTNVDVINCDSGGTNYKLHRESGLGTVDHETTKIRSSGASDGTTGISHKMISNANTTFPMPLEGFEIATWNDNSGSSKTATVEILTDSATALNNDDVWLELSYLGSASFPTASFGNNAKADVLQSNAAQTTSSVTWTTTGITNVMKQKLQVSFTPQQKGPVKAKVVLAKPSTTVYVDPLVTIS